MNQKTGPIIVGVLTLVVMVLTGYILGTTSVDAKMDSKIESSIGPVMGKLKELHKDVREIRAVVVKHLGGPG